MSPGKSIAIIATCIIGGLVAIALVVAMALASIYNEAVSNEAGLSATLENNRSILSNYYQKVAEAGEVSAMMTDAQKDIIATAMNGRYGDDGSRAVFQMLQEQNPQVSEAIFTKLQTIIEAGRDEIKNNNTLITDKLRIYEIDLNSMPKGVVLSFMGFPRKNLDQFKVITTEKVDEIYKTGHEAGPAPIRPTKN